MRSALRRRTYRQILALSIAASSLISGLLLFSPLTTVRAFKPNAFFAANAGDMTHEKITEDAIKELIESERIIPGVTKVDDQMKKAIKQITEGNAYTDGARFFDDRAHYTSDELAGSQQRVVDFYNSVKIALRADKLLQARLHLGTALHGIQDFYSHSNWIESGNGSINPQVGDVYAPGNLVASGINNFLGELACRDCPLPGTCTECTDNIITTRVTTAWFDINPFRNRKPFGRCSHGGAGDFSANFSAKGGINKDSTSCSSSPHSSLHFAAAAVAKAHTKEFIRLLKKNVTLQQFRALLGVGPTLALAVDTSGSMDQEIAGVVQGATAIVNSRLESDLEPSKYVLVEINDPGTLLFETDDANSFLQALAGLNAHDGEDCPELAFTAMSKALDRFDESGGELLAFTDAAAKDTQLAGNVVTVAEKNDVDVTMFLSGSCSPYDPEYFRVARETGGQVFIIDPNETFEATKLAGFTVRPNSVDIAHINGTLSATPVTYTVPVDSTLTSVTFSVSGSDSAIVKRPDGSTVQPADAGVNSANISGGNVLSITDPADGAWSVTVSGGGEFTIRVTGESPLHFSSFDIVKLGGVIHQAYFPFDGLPLVGQVSKVTAELSPGQFNSAQFELRTSDGALLQTLALSEIPNPEVDTTRQYLGDVSFPAVPVLVHVTGTDINGQPYQRVIPKTIKAQTVEVTAPRAEEIYRGQDLSYTAQVTNHGAPDTFKIEASDDYNFIRQISPSAFTLNTGETINVTVNLKTPADVLPGSRDVVTLNVESTGASEANNFAATELMVVPHLEIGPWSVIGGSPSVGTVRLFSGLAPEAGTVVTLSSSDTGVASVPASVTVEAESHQKSFLVETSAVSTVTDVTITASYGTVSETAVLKVTPAADSLVSVHLSPGKVLAGNAVEASVTLNGPAPAGGATVVLSSNSAAATVPSSVTIPEGATDGPFTITTTSVSTAATAQISATYNGINQSASLRIYPVNMEGISVLPEHLVGGASATATITLVDEAPAGGATVTLESGNSSIVTLPAQITVPAGDFLETFTVSTLAVTVPTTVAIRATYEGVSSTAYLRVTPGVVPSDLELQPSSLTGGQSSTATVRLNGPAPSGGTVVTLGSSDPAVTVAPSVTVPEGQTWTTFSIATTSVATSRAVIISAAANGVGQTELLTVDLTSLQSLTLLPSSIGAGNTGNGEVRLSNPAPAGGVFVSLRSNNTSMATVPATVTVPGGAVSATFPITTLPIELTSMTSISATYGETTRSAALRIFGANDVFATIAIGGPTVTVTTTNSGQNARLVFEGTAGTRVGLIMSGVTISSSSVSILNPDGTNLIAPTSVTTSGGFMSSTPLPVTGTYTILVDPSGTNVGSMTLRLVDVPPDVTGSLTPGGPPVTVTTTAPGQNGVLTFSGTMGQRISLKISGVAITGGSTHTDITIKKPDNLTLTSVTSIFSNPTFLDVQTLPATGTYTVVVDPRDTSHGSLTLTLYDVPADVNGSITAGGTPVTFTTTVPGQNGQLSFNGTAGQRVTLNMGDVLLAENGQADVFLRKPDGTNLATALGVGAGGKFINTQTLPVTGVYSIFVNPQSATSGSLTLTLNDVSADVSSTIVPGGPATTVTTTDIGQNIQVTFDGVADQRIFLKISGVAMTGGNGYVDVSIKKPDGTNLVSNSFINSSGGIIDTRVLPVTGTYTILVDPQGTNTGSVTLTLYDVPPDITGSIAPGGSSVTVTTTTPGQNGQLSFVGLTNQRVLLKISGVTLTGGTTNSATVAIKNPDGTTLQSNIVSASGGFIDTQTLPADGAYTILVDPANASTGSVTLTLYAVADDLIGSITPGDPAVTVSTTSAGQNVKLLFEGTANQRVSLRVTNVVLTGGTNNRATVAIRKPDGTNLASTTADSGGAFIDTKTLPVTGTYTLLVDPNDTATGSVTLTLFDVPPDVSGPIVPGGSVANVSTTTPGQNALLTFEGVINQRISMDITGVSVTNNGILTVVIRKPDGTNLGSSIVGHNNVGFIDVKILPVTGNYTVLVDPNTFNTASVNLKLYDVPADAEASTTLNATAVGIATTIPGQNAKVTFAGTTGQQVTVRFTNNLIGLVTVKLLKPDGSQQTSSISSSANFNLSTQTLNTTGTFTVSIDPSGNRFGSANVRVTSP